jgi:hypothetical protein
VQRIDALFDVERTINGKRPSERLAVRQDLSAPLVDGLHVWLTAQMTKLSRNHDLAKAINYMLRRWDAFTRFLGDGRICLTNNAAERALRCVPLGRKAWLFCGSDRGGQRAAVLYTMIQSARLNNIDPQAWLADVLARIAECPVSRLRDLLPGMAASIDLTERGGIGSCCQANAAVAMEPLILQHPGMIHVLFSSAAGTLRQILKARGQPDPVAHFTDTLDWGPIQTSSFVEREKWFDQFAPTDVGACDWLDESAAKFKQAILADPERLIWISPRCQRDLSGLHWFLAEFGGEGAKMIIADHPLRGTWRDEPLASQRIAGRSNRPIARRLPTHGMGLIDLS